MSVLYLGLLAGFLTSISAIPQVFKAFRTRRLRDISIWQPLLLAFGVGLWLVYGVAINDLPLIYSNIIPLACNVILVILKLTWREDDNCS